MISSTVCITEYEGFIAAWLDKNNSMEMLSITDKERDTTGDIYVGRVKHVVKNINACFVEFKEDTLGFLSFNDIYPAQKITEGTLIPVQIIKEASKNKEAVLTSKLSIAGDYCVLINDAANINVSRKISGPLRNELKEMLSDHKDLCITIRTNAAGADPSLIQDEVKVLSKKLLSILETAKTRNGGSLIYKSEPEYLKFIKSLPKDSYERILTDIEEVCDTISFDRPCQFYNDDYPLSKLYSLETKIEEILKKDVWLRSGGNIVIEHTEAMTVIDVNTAKNITRKDKDGFILSVNKEAAKEIARQVRLRNISGIIIVDFINMHSKEDIDELTEYVKELIRVDAVRFDYIDMTKLGLMELVRRKIKPPIYEILGK